MDCKFHAERLEISSTWCCAVQWWHQIVAYLIWWHQMSASSWERLHRRNSTVIIANNPHHLAHVIDCANRQRCISAAVDAVSTQAKPWLQRYLVSVAVSRPIVSQRHDCWASAVNEWREWKLHAQKPQPPITERLDYGTLDCMADDTQSVFIRWEDAECNAVVFRQSKRENFKPC